MEDLLPRLKHAIERFFPDYRAVMVKDLVCMNSGWESDVYSFTIEHGMAGSRQQRDMVLRIYPGGYAVHKAREEFKTLSILHRMSYPVPEVYRLETSGESLGQPFILMERIEGAPLWGLLYEGSEQQQAGWLRLFCKLFVQLHTLDWRPYVPEEVHKLGDPYACVRSQFEQATGQLQSMGLAGEFQPLANWFNVRLLDVPCTRPAVVHWDFHPQNILVRPNGDAVVIDWTGAAISDPRFDLAWTLLLIEAYMGEDWRARILAEYENQVGGALAGMEFFEAFACARRLFSVVGSIKAGAGALGMRPGAEEVMKKQVEPLRRVAARLKAITGYAPFNIDEVLLW
jgi:aminoglycoside phosphotransferase (APT) family kinase protein